MPIEIEKSDFTSSEYKMCRFLFETLDKNDVEEISLSSIILHFSCKMFEMIIVIDNRITEKWMENLLKEEGLKKKTILNYEDFLFLFRTIKKRVYEIRKIR